MGKRGTKKGRIISKIKSGMIDLIEIFKERDNVFKGLTSDEVISLFYKIPVNKVKGLLPSNRKSKWQTVRTIKKYLVKTRQLAIIYKEMPKGTELFDLKFGKRTLNISSNIFYKCKELEDAWDYRNKQDKCANGIIKSADSTVLTVESQQQEEIKTREIVSIIQKN